MERGRLVRVRWERAQGRGRVIRAPFTAGFHAQVHRKGSGFDGLGLFVNCV